MFGFPGAVLLFNSRTCATAILECFQGADSATNVGSFVTSNPNCYLQPWGAKGSRLSSAANFPALALRGGSNTSLAPPGGSMGKRQRKRG